MTIPNSSLKHMSIIISFLSLILMLYVLKPIMVPLLLAVILAVLIFPIQKFLEKKIKCNRLLATVCSIFIMFTLTLFLVITIGFQLQNLFDNTSTYINSITKIYEAVILQIENSLNINKQHSFLNQNFNFGAFLKKNFDDISSFALEWGSVLTNLVLIPIYMFFFLYYRKFFKFFAYKLFKNNSKSVINSIILKIYSVQRSYLLGLVKVILIVGVLNTIGLLILGIENAVFFGFFGAVLLIIPYIGVVIGSLLPALIALATKDSYWYPIGVIAVFGTIQFFEGYLITPKIIGDKVSVNAFVAIVSLLAFAMLWGVVGMVVALPVTAALKIVLDHSTNYKAFGFLIGAPEDRFLKSAARARLKKWKTH